VVEVGAGKTEVISPPLDFFQIKMGQESSTEKTTSCPDFSPPVPANLNWDSITALDNRVSIYQENFTTNFKKKEIEALLKYLYSLIKAGHFVECKLINEWGIKESFPRIIIQAVGPSNQAFGSGLFLPGDPKDFPGFFASPCALFAHELGHSLHLRRFNAEGKRLTFFEALPYSLMPGQLMPPSPDGDRFYGNLFNDVLIELIADKAALQLCGFEETQKDIAAKIKTSKGSKNPWILLFLLTLAKEFKLGTEEKWLLKKLSHHRQPWKKVASTQDLSNSLSKFFKQVSLKKQ